MKLFGCKHKWVTVALNQGFGWIRNEGKPEETTGWHLIRFVECSRCQVRDLQCDDIGEKNYKFAMEKHEDIAVARSKWVHGNIIENGKKITWMDIRRSPYGNFESWVRALHDMPDMKKTLENPTVAEALGQLEVAIKLAHDTTQP